MQDYFTFGTPSIPPIQFSLVMKSGHDGYACYKEGNDFVFMAPDATTGYTDGKCLEAVVHAYTNPSQLHSPSTYYSKPASSHHGCC
jgi:hypothetical protein